MKSAGNEDGRVTCHALNSTELDHSLHLVTQSRCMRRTGSKGTTIIGVENSAARHEELTLPFSDQLPGGKASFNPVQQGLLVTETPDASYPFSLHTGRVL
jgi:hypothetical protein